MVALLVFLLLLIIIGLNLVPQLFTSNHPRAEKTVTQVMAVTAVLVLLATILAFSGLKLKGLYSNSVIVVAFVLASLSYFAAVKNTSSKLIAVSLLVPLILFSLYTLLFERPIYEKKIADNYKIKVSTGGIMSCGELIRITKTHFGIFDKEVHYESSLCLIDINRIETIDFSQSSAAFLIYHDGEMNSENPYEYRIEDKNVW